jgi:hypothetical protein
MDRSALEEHNLLLSRDGVWVTVGDWFGQLQMSPQDVRG